MFGLAYFFLRLGLLLFQIDIFDNYKQTFDRTGEKVVYIFIIAIIDRHFTGKDRLKNSSKVGLQDEMIKAVIEVVLLAQYSVELELVVKGNQTTNDFQGRLKFGLVLNTSETAFTLNSTDCGVN